MEASSQSCTENVSELYKPLLHTPSCTLDSVRCVNNNILQTEELSAVDKMSAKRHQLVIAFISWCLVHGKNNFFVFLFEIYASETMKRRRQATT